MKLYAQIVILSLLLAITATLKAEAGVRVGTINSSWHYGAEGYNETHNGVGFEVGSNGEWFGLTKYTNSEGGDSKLLSYSNEGNVFGYSIGLADGYRKQALMPFVALTAKYSVFKVYITPTVVFLGTVFEIK